MAKLLDTLTIDGVTNQVNERQTYYKSTSSINLSASTTTTIASITIQEKGLYMFTGFIWFKDGTSAGQRMAYAEITPSGKNPIAQNSQRNSNQYGVYMTVTTSAYVGNVPLVVNLKGQSSIACNANTGSIRAERIYPVA